MLENSPAILDDEHGDAPLALRILCGAGAITRAQLPERSCRDGDEKGNRDEL